MAVSILDEIYLNTEQYQNQFPKETRKTKSQFFTSKLTAIKMSEYLNCDYEDATILDPGAGNAALTAAVVIRLADKGCKHIRCILVENDSRVLPLLERNVSIIERYAKSKNVSIDFVFEKTNFILNDNLQKVDIVIMNPPYKKIRKDSNESKKMSEYVYGQPNLYSLFMVKALNLLNKNGEFVFIVPRSWTSGEYYKTARKFILNNTDIKHLCIFNERDNSFSLENVLQETMIYSGRKDEKQSQYIPIDVSNDDSFLNIKTYTVNSDTIKNVGQNNYLLIPSIDDEIDILRRFSLSKKSFKDMGYEFKTGPVVEFRNKDEISIQEKPNYVPMFRSANIFKGEFKFPLTIDKAQYVSHGAKKLLVKNRNTIFVRRLSSKEEKRRIQCCVYNALNGYDFISIENHVNYLSKIDKSAFTQKELIDIYNLLSSDEYDAYFRLVNGSTQVNAKELNELPYFELEKLNEKNC